MNNDKEILINSDPNEDVYNDLQNLNSVVTSTWESNTQPRQLPTITQSIPPICYPVNNPKPKALPQFVAAITASLAAFASGTVLAWTSSIILVLEGGKYNNISINSDEMGWIGSFVTLGAMCTSFPFGIICDFIGRKAALLILIVPYSIGWSLIIWADSVLMLYFGRFISGMAAGACCVAAPLYISEIAHKSIRGTLGSYFQLMVTVGILFAYIVGKFATPILYTTICSMVPIVFFIVFVFQPESPFYCLKKGQFDSAYKNLNRLRGADYNVTDEIMSLRLLEESQQSSLSISCSLKRVAGYKAFIIALSLMFFQQLCGINAIIFYTPDIFTASGAKIDPQTATICVGAFQVVATFISSLMVDKLGRRMLLISSEFIMAISTIFLGLFFTLKDRQIIAEDVISVLGFLPVVSLCVFIIMFSMGLGPLPWTICSEIFSPELKSFAISSAVTLNWFLAFLVTKFYLKLELLIGSDVMFYVFSIICFIGTIFCYTFIPETKGKTIEQIQKELDGC